MSLGQTQCSYYNKTISTIIFKQNALQQKCTCKTNGICRWVGYERKWIKRQNGVCSCGNGLTRHGRERPVKYCTSNSTSRYLDHQNRIIVKHYIHETATSFSFQQRSYWFLTCKHQTALKKKHQSRSSTKPISYN